MYITEKCNTCGTVVIMGREPEPLMDDDDVCLPDAPASADAIAMQEFGCCDNCVNDAMPVILGEE